jgi:Vacuolar sorting protein 9 (VPS9) domain
VDKLSVINRTLNIISQVFRMASTKDNADVTADDELPMMIYVVSKSISAVKLYSNFQFIKLFSYDMKSGDNLQRALSILESVIVTILHDA